MSDVFWCARCNHSNAIKKTMGIIDIHHAMSVMRAHGHNSFRDRPLWRTHFSLPKRIHGLWLCIVGSKTTFSCCFFITSYRKNKKKHFLFGQSVFQVSKNTPPNSRVYVIFYYVWYRIHSFNVWHFNLLRGDDCRQHEGRKNFFF